MSTGDRAVRTADGPDGFAIWLTNGGARCPVAAGADPVSAPGPVRVSHLLAADDALAPGRWGAHITLCGAEIRGPSTTAAEHECCVGCDCEVQARYCLKCVLEADRWSAQARPS